MTARALENGVIGRIRVTVRAHTICIAVFQREEGVIAGWQGAGQPGGGGVAGSTRGGPSCCRVIRIGRAIVVGGVTRVTIGWSRIEHIIDVALDAIHRGVRTGKGEWRVVVIKGRAGPVRRCVARIAGGWESRRGVRRIGCTIPVCLVAPIAGSWQRAIIRSGGRVARIALQ